MGQRRRRRLRFAHVHVDDDSQVVERGRRGVEHGDDREDPDRTAGLDGLDIRFDEGDVERLPYADASFDVTLSMFGVMFAPRPELAAAELLRVTRPGGFIALASWTSRSFIAELIADASIDPWLNPDSRRVLDLCTGNGSLAVLAAMAWPDVDVDALDIDTHALAVAKLNVERHDMALRIRLLQGDGLAGAQGPYDLILCNPPYVNSTSMAALPAEYRAEPELALAGGSDGMDFIRELLKAAPAALNDDGVLVLEIGNEREHFEAAFPTLEVVWMETSSGADQVLLVTKENLL